MWDSFLQEFTKTFIRDNRWKIFLQGFENTLLITFAAALIGIATGIFVSLIHQLASDRRPLSKRGIGGIFVYVMDRLCQIYVALMRGTPLAVQLTIMAYIIMSGYRNKIVVCFVAFGINSGAYVSEVIRGGIESVDIGQTEAGRSLGLSRLSTLRMIVLPQAIKTILPALCNEGIAILKETSIVGLIAVVDLTRASDLVRSRTMSPYFPLISVAVVYFVLVYGLSKAVSALERRMKQSDRR